MRTVFRFLTAGSVDDGKSTLIGRLLYDSKALFSDQLDAIARSRHQRTRGSVPDLSLLTDGLEAEREQGITIDVAYRYFNTPARKFIIADSPGHEQYTRNMVTAASTADAIVLLIDATQVIDGKLLPQTKRHAAIARLLNIEHVIFAVNKLDLLDFDAAIYARIESAVRDLAQTLQLSSPHVLPLSALQGDNVVERSKQTPYYTGPTLLALLEALPAKASRTKARDSLEEFSFPVQWVIRVDGSAIHDFRGYAGQIAEGNVRVGDTLRVARTDFSSTSAIVTEIRLGEQRLQSARSGQSVILVLDCDVDIARGDTLVGQHSTRQPVQHISAELCWLDHPPLATQRRYLLKTQSGETLARVNRIESVLDVTTLTHAEAGQAIVLNSIARVDIEMQKPLLVTDYKASPTLGAFVLIDSATNQTAAAGMLRS